MSDTMYSSGRSAALKDLKPEYILVLWDDVSMTPIGMISFDSSYLDNLIDNPQWKSLLPIPGMIPVD